ncbi:hypothetical protein [Tengunoibacter tsumagoiensis]|uniref:Uncharacterized protein n=1 Tax=Tengunoibacter tsumagoiensis TaxID=2014871 RepID=A0A402A182_9CHLR|nr:hypothetical protein [Tengunoibacter tsumagoiensis]GCE12812.1 hypothetical protein KTT_26710 [Tengunoibacter tsumagoiensis]
MNLEEHLRNLRSSYAIGRVKPLVMLSDKDFQQSLDQEADLPLTPAEQAVFTKCAHFRVAALKAAREGNLAIADYLFTSTETLIESQDLSPVATLMMRSAHEAAVAYLDYRRQEYDSGTARIYRALAIDESLENDYGYGHYHLHRLRLLLNLIRLKRRQGEIAEAFQMSVAIVDYMEQKRFSLPFPTTWDAHALSHLAVEPRNFLFEQALFEILFMVVGREGDTEAMLQMLNAHTCSVLSEQCYLSPRLHRWLESLQALQDQQIDRYCLLIQPLLAAGPNDSLWLWYGLLLELVQLCQKWEIGEAQMLGHEIMADMTSWQWSRLPPSWKRISEQMMAYSHA